VVVLLNGDTTEIIRQCSFDSENNLLSFKTQHFSQYSIQNNEVNFNDLANVEWARPSIEALAAREIINGTGGGNYSPEANLTREEFIKMVVSTFGLLDETAECTFTDVSQDQWYYKYVASAQKRGITNGIGGNMFGVSSKIKRQDAAVLISRILDDLNIEIPKTVEALVFTDENKIDTYAKEHVANIQQMGIMQGRGNNTFAPADYIKRSEIAVMVYRTISKHVE